MKPRTTVLIVSLNPDVVQCEILQHDLTLSMSFYFSIRKRQQHFRFYNRVADQMDAYREAIDAKKLQNENNNNDDHQNLPVSEPRTLLPSDEDISKTLRAHRDRHGTRQKPIGIVRALQHLLQDLGVPVSAFGEYTYTTLMTCCRTPQEGRRVFKLMRDQNNEISSYSWSILVDVSQFLVTKKMCC